MCWFPIFYLSGREEVDRLRLAVHQQLEVILDEVSDKSAMPVRDHSTDFHELGLDLDRRVLCRIASSLKCDIERMYCWLTAPDKQDPETQASSDHLISELRNQSYKAGREEELLLA